VLNAVRPLVLLIIFAQGQQLDVPLLPEPVFQFRVIEQFVADEDQITSIQHQGIQDFGIKIRCWSYTPIINQLIDRHGGVQPQTKEFAFLAGHDTKVLAADHTGSPCSTRVRHQRDRGTIHQANGIGLIQFLIAQIAANRLDDRDQVAAAGVEPIQVQQLRE
jgi:hypothetical protein